MTTTFTATEEKTSVAKSSLYGAIFITALKIVVGFSTGSLGILAEAAHSALDFLAAGITFIAVKIADKPADKDHTYGHGKAENFAALVETLLLLATCIWIIVEAVERLVSQKVHIEVSVWAFVVMGISIVVDYSRSRALYRVAQKYNNQALEADALHFSTDIWSSAVVIAGLIFASFEMWAADAIAAAIVAMIVTLLSYKLGKKTVDALMDKIPDGVYEKIHTGIERVAGIEKVMNLRLRQAGPKLFLDVTVALKRTLPFEIAHNIVSNIEQKILSLYPNADSIVHAEPIETSEETFNEKIAMLVAAEGMLPHHIRTFSLEDKNIAELHMECSSANDFVTAHSISEKIEHTIREKYPHVTDVRIHIEEISAPEKIVDITSNAQTIVQQLRTIAKEETTVLACEHISVYQLESGKLKIGMNCTFRNVLSLDTVHSIVSKIENTIYSSIPNVQSVLVHAEPSMTFR
ncbi:MAG: cation-efflux pump [Ignavibacteria bacterium]|nr:cation-efflux pump [Ignavibacteria bacterium]